VFEIGFPTSIFFPGFFLSSWLFAPPPLRFDLGLYLNLEIPSSGVHLSAHAPSIFLHAESMPGARATLPHSSERLTLFTLPYRAAPWPSPGAVPLHPRRAGRRGWTSSRAAGSEPAAQSGTTEPPRRCLSQLEPCCITTVTHGSCRPKPRGIPSEHLRLNLPAVGRLQAEHPIGVHQSPAATPSCTPTKAPPFSHFDVTGSTSFSLVVQVPNSSLHFCHPKLRLSFSPWATSSFVTLSYSSVSCYPFPPIGLSVSSHPTVVSARHESLSLHPAAGQAKSDTATGPLLLALSFMRFKICIK
jgi:hypothetical protein